MRGRSCRSIRVGGATCKGWHVALHGDPERHARAGMSLRTRVKSDIDRAAASPDRSSKATYALLLGAPGARVVRHAAATPAKSTRETVAFGSLSPGPLRLSRGDDHVRVRQDVGDPDHPDLEADRKSVV